MRLKGSQCANFCPRAAAESELVVLRQTPLELLVGGLSEKKEKKKSERQQQQQQQISGVLQECVSVSQRASRR